MVLAYKFLDRLGRSAFTGQPWPLPDESGPGAWLEAAEVDPCRSGIHACRADDLAYWLHHGLWEIELDQDIVAVRQKVVARRGRIVRAVERWSTVWPQLAAVSAWRARDLAVESLTARNMTEPAERFGAVDDLGELAALADLAENWGDGTFVGRAMALAADGGHFAANGEPAQAPFVAAVAAGHAAAGESGSDAVFDAAFAAERRSQSAWIRAHLNLN